MKRALVLLAACGGLGNAQQRLRTAVDAQQAKLDKCFTRSLARDSDGAGAMVLVLHVSSGGTIDDIQVQRTEVKDPKLQNCVKATFRKIQLQPAPSSDFEIVYTLKFKDDST